MGDPVVQWQIITSDPTRVAEFYRELFGWTVRADNALGYRELKSGNKRGIDGGVWPAPPEAPTFVQLFVEVEDVDASIAKALERGAQVLVPKSALPDGDVMAVLRDPLGLSFGLVARRS